VKADPGGEVHPSEAKGFGYAFDHRTDFAVADVFTIGRPLSGLVCLILQVTLIGWLPAAIWAVYALSQYKTDEKIDRALRQRAGGG